jgi:hypothetical protein
MTAKADDRIDALIHAQRPGFSLDRAFYEDAEIFERDRQRVLRNHWILAAHASQFEKPGDYRLFDVAGDSVILLRDRDDTIRAHHNVCRHRGSRILPNALRETSWPGSMTAQTIHPALGGSPTLAADPKSAWAITWPTVDRLPTIRDIRLSCRSRSVA